MDFTIILIAVLCVIVGVLGGVLFMNRNKSGKADGKRSSKAVKGDKIKNRDGVEVKLVERLPMEFSKKIIYSVAALTLIIVLAALVMSYMTQSTDVFAYLIPSIFLELGVGTLFYYRKAEAENLLRESNRHEIEMKQLKDEDIV